MLWLVACGSSPIPWKIRSSVVDLLDRAISALPDGVEHIRCRWDAGYVAADLANACITRGVRFAIGAKRTRPLMSAAIHVPGEARVPAIGMEDTEVARIARHPEPPDARTHNPRRHPKPTTRESGSERLTSNAA